MNSAKFIRTPFLQNTSGRLLLKIFTMQLHDNDESIFTLFILKDAVWHFACYKCVIWHVKLNFRGSNSEVFLIKGVLKICSKFIGEHPCRSVISIKLLCNFLEIKLRNACSPVNLLHIFRTTFTKNTSGWLLLEFVLIDYTLAQVKQTILCLQYLLNENLSCH